MARRTSTSTDGADTTEVPAAEGPVEEFFPDETSGQGVERVFEREGSTRVAATEEDAVNLRADGWTEKNSRARKDATAS